MPSWLVSQLDTVATAAGAICGWEAMKALDRRRKRKRGRVEV